MMEAMGALTRWLKRLVIGSPFEGIALRVYQRLAPHARYDTQTIAVMKRCLREDSNGVDVGCHTGAILKEMLHFAPAGTHYAFEPIPELYRGLRSSFPGVKVFNLALSDAAGETSFQHVTSNPAYSGLRRRRYDRPAESVKEITVRTDRLDDVIPHGVPVHFIKIDVEGGELQVLRGALGTIRRNRPIVVFEHGLGAADYYGSTPEDVYDLLTAHCGLRISLMEQWLRDGPSLERAQFVDQFRRGLNFYFMAHA
jgi:FkbM family methyltransferase